MKPQRPGQTQEAERASSIPIILSPNLCLSKVQWRVRIKNRTLQPPTSMQVLTINLPKSRRLRGLSHRHDNQEEEEKEVESIEIPTCVGRVHFRYRQLSLSLSLSTGSFSKGLSTCQFGVGSLACGCDYIGKKLACVGAKLEK